MSLINTMLNELENRKKTDSSIAYPFLKEKKKNQYFVFILASIGVIMLTLILLSINFYKSHFQVKNDKSSYQTIIPFDRNINASHSINQLSKDDQFLSSAEISGISLQLQGDVTELVFFLDHPILYHLKKNEMDNTLRITFENTTSNTELPSLNEAKIAVSDLTKTQHKNDSFYVLTLKPGSEIKSTTLREDSGRTEFVVAIQYRQQQVDKIPFSQGQAKNNFSAMQKKPTINSNSSIQYEQAVQYAEANQYDKSIESLNDLLRIDPYYDKARTMLVALLLDQGFYQKADSVIDTGLSIQPNIITFLELKARILAAEGKIKQAVLFLEKSSPPIENNQNYYALKAAFYEQSGKEIQAMEVYKKLLRVDANNGSWWFGYALALDELNRHKEAIKAYTMAQSKGQLGNGSLALLNQRLSVLRDKNYVGN